MAKGFPVVTDRENMAVVGYMRRHILERLIEVALLDRAVRPQTPCIFSRTFCPATGVSRYLRFFVYVQSMWWWTHMSNTTSQGAVL
jgi:hypothetical protein